MNSIGVIACIYLLFSLNACSKNSLTSSDIKPSEPEKVTRSGKELSVDSEGPVLLVTHPTKIFDSELSAKAGIDQILSKFLNLHMSHFVFVAHNNLEKYYAEGIGKSEIYYSISGGHSLTFTKARKFLVAGGHLLFCFCETLRDLILGFPVSTKIEIHFLSDAIYLPGPNSDGSWGKSYETGRPIKNLNTFMNEFSDEYLLNFVKVEMFRDGIFCDQNPFEPYSLLSLNQLTVDVKRRGVHIGSVGNGPFHVVFNFTEVSEITIK